MAERINFDAQMTRSEKYTTLLRQIPPLLAGETDLIANLANVAALLKEVFGFHWVGFYRRVGEELILGPFQGPPACTRIPLAKGVCGAAARGMKTVLVPDVEKFPGHIACSSLSRSEIVVPLVVGGKTELVLDVDSERLNDFSKIDQQGLESLIAIILHTHFHL